MSTIPEPFLIARVRANPKGRVVHQNGSRTTTASLSAATFLRDFDVWRTAVERQALRTMASAIHSRAEIAFNSGASSDTVDAMVNEAAFLADLAEHL